MSAEGKIESQQPYIRIISKGEDLKIYFGELLHLRLRLQPLPMLKSWIDEVVEGGVLRKHYYIEFIYPNVRILAEYDRRDYWEVILKDLDDRLF